MQKVLAIVGPTASSKTEISIRVAEKLNGEIISADSRLVYNDFNIGTAKPSKEEMGGITHHMVDVASPESDFSVGLYQSQVQKIIQDVCSRGKTPIIAGGTGLYIRSVLEGLDMPKVEADEEYRKELNSFARAYGREALHSKLREIDPESAENIHMNNVVRVVRALEVCKVSGKKFSEQRLIKTPQYDVIYAGLNSEDRDYLYDRINRRVDIMLETGLVAEVDGLIKKYGKTLSLLKTLGYKEISEYLDGEVPLDTAVERIKKNTRNFAKRQLTWFRANPDINWYNIDKMQKEEIIEEIVKLYNV